MVTRPFQATQFDPLNLEGSAKVGGAGVEDMYVKIRVVV
jgi:hypothetical protein